MEKQQQISNRKIGTLNNTLLIGSALLIVYILVYFKYYHTNYPLHGIYTYLLPFIIISVSFISILFLTSTIQLTYNANKIVVKYFYLFQKKIDLNDIDTIDMVYIDALSDFLGIGYRISDKYGIGIIAGDGNALLFKLKNNKKITVSIENIPNIIEKIEFLIKK
jgi:hypothetical protein